MNGRRAVMRVLGAAALLALTQAASAEMMARLQRFAQRDPLRLRAKVDAGDSDGTNLYLYTRAAPWARTDPTGLDTCCCRFKEQKEDQACCMNNAGASYYADGGTRCGETCDVWSY